MEAARTITSVPINARSRLASYVWIIRSICSTIGKIRSDVDYVTLKYRKRMGASIFMAPLQDKRICLTRLIYR